MNKRALTNIFCVVFIDLVGFGIIIPILPYYAKAFGANATVLGLLMMSYSAMQFLFSPFWGRLSDKIGRRPVLLTTIFGIGGSMVVLGFAQSLEWLFAGRLLAGFFGANIATASAYIADITPPEKRAKGMGLIGAAFGMGFLFGPAIGGFLSQWGYGTAAFAAALLALLNFFFALATLREPELSEETRYKHRNHLDGHTWRRILQNAKTGVPILLFFLVTLGIAQMETTFALLLLARFGLDAPSAGYILAAMAIVLVAIQGGGIGRLAARFGEKKLVLAGTLLMMAGLLGASFSMQLALFILALLIQATGYGLTNPSLMSLVSRGAQQGRQGGTMGIYQSAGSLARIFGPILAGILFDRVGITAPFMVACGFFLLAFLIAVTRK